MAREVLEVEARLKDFITQNLKGISKEMQTMGQKAQAAGQQATKALSPMQKMAGSLKDGLKSLVVQFSIATLVVKGFAVAMRLLGNAIRFVQDRTDGFEKTLSKVKAILQPTGKEFDALSAKAKQLGETTAFTASQAGDAFVMMGKLGLNAGQIIDASTGILNLAAAAEVNMADAANVVIASLNQFGLAASESTHVADVMAKSFTTSALDMDKFSNAMKMAGPVAGNTGTSIEELTGVFAILADRGIDASLAGTAMRRILLEMADSSSLAGKALAKQGAESGTLAEKFQALKDAGIDVTKMTEMFSLRGTTSAQVASKNAEAVAEAIEVYKEADGTVKKMSETMLDNVRGAQVIMKSALEGLAIAFGEAFGVDKQARIEAITKFIRKLTEIVKAHQSEIIFLGKAYNWAIRIGVILIEKLVNRAIMIANAIRLPFDTLVTGILSAVEAGAKIVNWLAKKVGKEAVFEMAVIEEAAKDAGERMAKTVGNLMAAMGGTAFKVGGGGGAPLGGGAVAGPAEAPAAGGGGEVDNKAIIAAIKEEIKLLQEKVRIAKETEGAFMRLRDVRIAAVTDANARELMALDAKHADELAKIGENEVAKTALLIAHGEERAALLGEQDAAAAQVKQDLQQQVFDQSVALANQAATFVIGALSQERNAELAKAKASIAASKMSSKEKEAALKRAEQANKEAAKKEKAIAIVMAVINTALAITNALNNAFPYNLVLAGLAAAAGAVQIATIASQNFSKGGIVQGNSFSGDGVPANLNSGEAVLTRQQQADLFDVVTTGSTNNAGSSIVNNGGESTINITLNGGATQGDADMLVSALEEAQRDGRLENIVGVGG